MTLNYQSLGAILSPKELKNHHQIGMSKMLLANLIIGDRETKEA